MELVEKYTRSFSGNDFLNYSSMADSILCEMPTWFDCAEQNLMTRLQRIGNTKMSRYYYAIDGDDIGKKLEKFALSNDLDSIKYLSEKVYSCLNEISRFLESNGANIVFCAGDSILASSDTRIEINISNISFDKFSFSAGIGMSCCNATLALMKAKGLGKKRIEVIL